MKTLGVRVKELRALAVKRGVAGKVGDLPDARLAIRAYAVVLKLDVPLAYDLTLTLGQVEEMSLLLNRPT